MNLDSISTFVVGIITVITSLLLARSQIKKTLSELEMHRSSSEIDLAQKYREFTNQISATLFEKEKRITQLEEDLVQIKKEMNELCDENVMLRAENVKLTTDMQALQIWVAVLEKALRDNNISIPKKES